MFAECIHSCFAAETEHKCVHKGSAFRAYVQGSASKMGAGLGVQAGIDGVRESFFINNLRQWLFFRNFAVQTLYDMKKSIVFFAMAAMLLCGVSAWGKQTTLMLIGDGTMADYAVTEDSHVRGWGQMLATYLAADVAVENAAETGMCAKALVADNRIDSLLGILKKKDVVLIQLGQNDLREDHGWQYSSIEELSHSLAAIVETAKAKKLQVILCTPLAQPYYRDGVLVNRLGGYPEAARRVAGQKNVPLIDLEAVTRVWLTEIGEDGAQAYYADLDTQATPDGEYLLNEAGAMVVGKMVVEGIQALNDKKLSKLIALPVQAE